MFDLPADQEQGPCSISLNLPTRGGSLITLSSVFFLIAHDRIYSNPLSFQILLSHKLPLHSTAPFHHATHPSTKTTTIASCTIVV